MGGSHWQRHSQGGCSGSLDIGIGVGVYSNITGIALFVGHNQLTVGWPFVVIGASLEPADNATFVVLAFAKGHGKVVVLSQSDNRLHTARTFNSDNCVKNEKKRQN